MWKKTKPQILMFVMMKNCHLSGQCLTKPDKLK